MSPLKVIIPLFIVLGILQAAIIALPFIYWRLQPYMGPINKFLFASVLIFTAFVVHPLIVIGLITFTIAPTLLSFRRNLTSHASTIYTTLVPQALPAIPLLDKGLPQNNKEWAMTLLGGYAGWRLLGVMPSLMILLVVASLYLGKEDELTRRRGWLANKGLRGEKNERVRERGIGVRSERTDVQVVR